MPLIFDIVCETKGCSRENKIFNTVTYDRVDAKSIEAQTIVDDTLGPAFRNAPNPADVCSACACLGQPYEREAAAA